MAKNTKKPKIERNSRKILKRLEKDGWTVVRIAGSHHQLKHDDSGDLITLPHPKKDLPKGTVREIYKVAGWL